MDKLKLDPANSAVKSSSEEIKTTEKPPSSQKLNPDRASARPLNPYPLSKHYEAELDTAISIAKRYGLDPKKYRGKLRKTISWYRKPQKWAFAIDSPEWKDMIAVAKAMTR
jgi:hypothetical protein